MTLKEYDGVINGHPTTVQLDDDDAVLYGVKEPEKQQPKKPVEDTSTKETPTKAAPKTPTKS